MCADSCSSAVKVTSECLISGSCFIIARYYIFTAYLRPWSCTAIQTLSTNAQERNACSKCAQTRNIQASHVALLHCLMKARRLWLYTAGTGTQADNNCKRATTCQQGECSKQSPSNTTKDDLRPVCLWTAYMTLAVTQQCLCNMLNGTTPEEP